MQIILILTCLLSGSILTAAEANEPHLPSPLGRRTIATTKFIWTDNSRTDVEPGSQPKPRQVIVQLWYPAVRPLHARRAPYMLEYEALKTAFGSEPEFAKRNETFAHIVTSAWLDAPLAPSTVPYPVIAFSHGLGMPRALYTTYYQNLASSGYVVAVIDHPGMGLTALPDRVAQVYPPLGLEGPPGLREKPEEERDAFWKTEELYLAADQRFVIDQLSALNRGEGPKWFRGQLDDTRFVHIGHSRGFASITCAHDARVKACVNLEGSPQMSERLFGLPHALLTLRSPGRRGLISRIHAAARVPSYDVEIQTAEHNSVSDLGVLGPSPGRASAERNLRIISSYTLAFLQHALKNENNVASFTGLNRRFPEAVVVRYDAMGQKYP